MPQMILYPNPDSVTQLRRTDCDWVFYVQKPLTPDLPLETQRHYAERWFAKHRCFSHTPPPTRQFVTMTVATARG